MNTETKIHLSKLERELIQNKEWILTKRSVTDKVYRLFGEMHTIYKEIAEQETSSFIGLYKNTGGKISKGENYKELPYVILDYPALFTKENIFAIRTMFWWGNFFSISLHLSGKEFQVQKNFSQLFSFLTEHNFYICVNEDEWQHNYEPSNYLAVADLNEKTFREISKRNFFKISKRLKVHDWDAAPHFLEKSFKEIIDFLKISFPVCEKDL